MIVEGATTIIAEKEEVQATTEAAPEDKISDDELREFVKQMGREFKINHWGHLLLQADVAAGFQVLVDLLIDKGVLTEEDSAKLDKSLQNKEFMEANAQHMAKAYQAKSSRIQYAIDHPEEVIKHEEERKSQEATVKE